MARTKKTPPPLAGLRLDFVDSLEATATAAMLLLVAIKTAIQFEQLKPAGLDAIKKEADALSLALFGHDLLP